jgi:hypothetical protein
MNKLDDCGCYIHPNSLDRILHSMQTSGLGREEQRGKARFAIVKMVRGMMPDRLKASVSDDYYDLGWNECLDTIEAKLKDLENG